jgi:sugar/nucleoside kinase (ribokinase family)
MFPNVLREFTPEDVINKHAEYIRSSRILQVEACVLPLNIMLAALRIAKEAGVKTVFDLDVQPSEIEISGMGTRKELDEMIELTDVLVPCKRSAAELLGSDDYLKEARELLKLGPKQVAITLGSDGCLMVDEENYAMVPKVPIDKVVDTTGAGDAFHGGIIYSLLKDMDLYSAGRFANACGAKCCTKLGARSMGTVEEIEALLNRQSPQGE